MTSQTGDVLHADAVDLPVLVTTETRILLGFEGMDGTAVTILAGKLFHEYMTGMARRFVYRKRALRCIVPVAFRAGLPRSHVPVRFSRFPAGRKNEFYQQHVLLHHAELVAFLANDIPVTREFPCRVCLFHEMAAAAEIGVFLDKVVVPDRKHDTQNRDKEHERDNDVLVPRAESLFELVEYL
jgi:hypothetical protein